MAWANQGGTWNDYDMDSVGRKLKVTGSTPNDSTFQVDVEDADSRGNALRVKGNITLQRGTETCGKIETFSGGALSVKDGNDSECISIGNDTTSLVSGTVQVGGGTSVVTINGSVPRVESQVFQVDHVLEVLGEIRSAGSMDSVETGEVLNLGTTRAGQVVIGRASHVTGIQGRLSVVADANIGTNVVAGGNVTGNAFEANSLTVNGETKHTNVVKMSGFAIITGGDGTTNETRVVHANNRLEFWVGGQVRAYVNTTGIHNA